MKHIIQNIIICAFFLVCQSGLAGTENGITLDKLIIKFSQKNAGIICGIEVVEGLNGSIKIDLEHLFNVQDKIPYLEEQITKQTDYQIIARPGIVFICPKESPENKTKPLSLRYVHFPELKKANLVDAVASLRDDNEIKCLNHLLVAPSSFYPKNTITLEGGNQSVADILSEFARQSGAKRWRIAHSVLSINNKLATVRPYDLSKGIVFFEQ